MASFDILILADLPHQVPADFNPISALDSGEWDDERDVFRALERLGHRPRFHILYDDLVGLMRSLIAQPPDLVFFLSESFANRRELAAPLLGCLELLGIRYTGVTSRSTHLCMDKGLTKKILSYHRIRVPHFHVSSARKPLKRIPIGPLPLLVKPLGLAASEGITLASLVHSTEDAIAAANAIHEKYQCDAILEEFIDGREIYLSVMNDGKIRVFPPQELFFSKMPEDLPKFATYKAKWDDTYRKKWGIQSGAAHPINDLLLRNLQTFAKKVFKVLDLNGYARIDVRLRNDEQIFFLEANPNPSIAQDGEFAKAALQSGLTYDQLIQKILKSAIAK